MGKELDPTGSEKTQERQLFSLNRQMRPLGTGDLLGSFKWALGPCKNFARTSFMDISTVRIGQKVPFIHHPLTKAPVDVFDIDIPWPTPRPILPIPPTVCPHRRFINTGGTHNNCKEIMVQSPLLNVAL